MGKTGKVETKLGKGKRKRVTVREERNGERWIVTTGIRGNEIGELMGDDKYKHRG